MYFPLEYRNFETASELYVAAGGPQRVLHHLLSITAYPKVTGLTPWSAIKKLWLNSVIALSFILLSKWHLSALSGQSPLKGRVKW